MSCSLVATSQSRVLDFKLPITLPGDAAGDERLGVDGPPIGNAQRVDVGNLLDVGGGIDRREQAGAL